MNEQALGKKEKSSTSAPTRRLGLFAWLLRLAVFATVCFGGILLWNSGLVNTPSIAESSENDPLEEEYAPTESIAVVAEFTSADPEATMPPIAINESLEVAETPVEPEAVKEPVPITSITSCIDQHIIDEAEHPLQPLIEMAEHGVDIVGRNVQDYTAVITKRVRSEDGKLQPEFKIFCKIRHPVESEDPGKAVPFSIYTRFLNPKKGQEAIWVEDRFENKLVAHGPSGLLNLMTLHLEPEGSMAMSGNRYPIMSIGMLNLVKKMIEKGTNDIDHDDCKVVLTRNVIVGGARCTKIEIIHENKQDYFEFHRAEIYIDDDRNLPIAFRSFLWPDKPGGKPKLLERYSYSKIKLNVGLTDDDFDPANEAYDYPGM